MTKTLLSLGHGYSARELAPHLLSRGWRVLGTTRREDRAEEFRAEGVTPILWERYSVQAALQEATHILVSASPAADGDPSLELVGDVIEARANDLDWVGYLSTTGVYGDHQGRWVDENTPVDSDNNRSKARIEAEHAWSTIPGLPLHIFRLAGIYGPGRGPFAKVRKGTARRIIKEGQVFSRIHVEDIATVCLASIDRPNPGAVYNVCDNEPAPPEDVIGYAATLLGLPEPPAIPFEEADLTPMARSFYLESRRVSNERIKTELGVTLRYPDYRTGLTALLDAEAT